MKLSLILIALFAAGNVSGQPAGTDYTVGVPVAGEKGIQRTTAEIMAAERRAPRTRPPLRMPEHEIKGRESLPQNLDAKPTSSTPDRGKGAAKGNLVVAEAGLPPLSAPQTIGITFDAVTGPTENGAFPPDTMGAVGPSQFFLFVNGRLRTFSKATGTADGVINANPNIFFNSVMTPVSPPVVLNFTSDPQIRYDRLSGRWFVAIIDVPCTSVGCGTLGANRWMVAVSDAASTPAITAATVWTFFFFQTDPANFCDYPSLGVDSQALYVGCDMFTSAPSFVGTNGYVVRKSSLLTGGPIVVTSFADLGTVSLPGPVAPRGVDNYDSSANEGYFIGPDLQSLGTLMLRRVSDPGGTPAISPNISITVATTSSSIPIQHLGNTAGNNGRIDSLDDRFYAAHIRNGRLWTAHNIRVDATGVASTGAQSREAVRWYELNGVRSADNGGVPVVVQSGTIFDNAATLAEARAFSIPTIMVSGQGHAALGFTTAGAPFRIDAATNGRLAGDPLGTTQTVALYTTSSTAYNPPGDPGGVGGRRWGDYSYTSLDPNDDMTIWTVEEYCNGTNTYGCRVAQLLAPPPAKPASVNTSVPVGEPSIDVVVTGSSTTGSGFYDPGPGFSNRIAATVSGGVVVNSVTFIDPTHVTLNLDTTGAPEGAKDVSVTNPDLQTRTGTGILIVASDGTPSPTATATATVIPTSTPTLTPTPTPSPTPKATPTPTPPAQALNLSTRMRVEIGERVGIGGFIITGSPSATSSGPSGTTKRVIVRAIGPSLAGFGVYDAMADPVLELHGPTGFTTIMNDDWRDSQEAEITATGLAPTDSHESAIVADLDNGNYTAIVAGKNNTTGVALIEVYDMNAGNGSKLGNISTRAFVSTGGNIVIAGFILANSTLSDQVIVRGIGPSLGGVGISDALADPTLEVRNSSGTLLEGNNNWQDDPAQAAIISAAGLAPGNPMEAAIARTLSPGQYTVLLAGLNDGTGTGLVEVYDRGR